MQPPSPHSSAPAAASSAAVSSPTNSSPPSSVFLEKLKKLKGKARRIVNASLIAAISGGVGAGAEKGYDWFRLDRAPWDGAVDLDDGELCSPDPFADVRFPLKEGIPQIEGKQDVVFWDRGKASLEKIHPLTAGGSYQCVADNGVVYTLKIISIDPVKRAIRFQINPTL